MFQDPRRVTAPLTNGHAQATLDYDFFIDFTAETAKTEALVAAISPLVQLVSVVAEDKVMPWFPRKIGDLDEFAAKVLEMGEELSADHPGFTDPAYRERRQKIAEIARTYKQCVIHDF